MVQFAFGRENRLKTPDDHCFSTAYLFACAAYRINPAHWHDPEVRQDPKIREFIQRVEFNITVDEKDFGLAQLEDPRTYQMRLGLVAKGVNYMEKIPYVKGLREPVEFKNTDEELINKFIDNASRILSSHKAKELAQTLLELERVKNVEGMTKGWQNS